MSEGPTWDHVIGAGTLLAAALGLFGRYVSGLKTQIKEVDDKAKATSDELAAHKVTVAENYVSLERMRDFKDEIKGSIGTLKEYIERLIQHRSPT